MKSAHPEAFAVRNTQDLPAVRAKIDIPSAEHASQLLVPQCRQLLLTMRADRLDIFFSFKFYHGWTSSFREG
jgi:hypothetical protein